MRDAEKIKKIDQYIYSSPASVPVVAHILIQGDKPFVAGLKGNV